MQNKVSLDDYLIAMQAEGADVTGIARRAYRDHGGLAAKLQREHYNTLEPYEIQSYWWEALVTRYRDFDPSKGKASTFMRKCVRLLLYHRSFADCKVGSVRVPVATKDRHCEIDMEHVCAYMDTDDDDCNELVAYIIA